MKFRKGQAALDFLMTYGWAIALVVIIAAVLFALGIFDVSNFVGSKAAGFSGVAVSGWKLAPTGNLSMKVSNQVGQPITVSAVNATIGTSTVSLVNTTSQFNLSTGQQSSEISATGFGNPTVGSGYTAKVTIVYTDLTSGFSYTTTGTLTGKVSG